MANTLYIRLPQSTLCAACRADVHDRGSYLVHVVAVAGKDKRLPWYKVNVCGARVCDADCLAAHVESCEHELQEAGHV